MCKTPHSIWNCKRKRCKKFKPGFGSFHVSESCCCPNTRQFLISEASHKFTSHFTWSDITSFYFLLLIFLSNIFGLSFHLTSFATLFYSLWRVLSLWLSLCMSLSCILSRLSTTLWVSSYLKYNTVCMLHNVIFCPSFYSYV